MVHFVRGDAQPVNRALCTLTDTHTHLHLKSTNGKSKVSMIRIIGHIVQLTCFFPLSYLVACCRMWCSMTASAEKNNISIE